VFMRGGALRSPMGRDLAAFSSSRDTSELRRTFGGDVVTWAEVRSLQIPHSHDAPTR
jgi:nitrous oxide reductase accessory protein NosL